MLGHTRTEHYLYNHSGCTLSAYVTRCESQVVHSTLVPVILLLLTNWSLSDIKSYQIATDLLVVHLWWTCLIKDVYWKNNWHPQADFCSYNTVCCSWITAQRVLGHASIEVFLTENAGCLGQVRIARVYTPGKEVFLVVTGLNMIIQDTEDYLMMMIQSREPMYYKIIMNKIVIMHRVT